MISKNDIIKMARHIMRRGSDLPDRKLMHPYREWYIGLTITVVIVLSGALYNAYVFNYYNTLEEHVTASAPQLVEYRREVVDRVLERYETRAEAFNTLRGSSAAFPPAEVSVEEEIPDDAEPVLE